MVDNETKNYVNENVLPRLFNPDKLEHVIDHDFLHWIDHGLIVTLFVPTPDKDGFVTITNQGSASCNLDEEALLKQAIQNVRKSYEVKDLNDPLRGLGIPAGVSLCAARYVYAAHGLYGANALLNSEILDELAEDICKDMWQQLVIVPTSVHDLMVFPWDGEEDLEPYEEALHDINAESDKDDILYDGVFTYDPSDHELRRYWKEEGGNADD